MTRLLSLGPFRGIEPVVFQAGDVIFATGDTGEHMYFINEGEVEIRIGAYSETVGAGTIFGEMALIDKSARSATASAKTDCKLVPVDRRKFQFLVQETPFFALEVMTIMAERLRRTNARIATTQYE